MKIHLNDIKACAQCPAYYHYLKDGIQRPEKAQISIASKVIKRCYVQATETHFKVGWRSVIGQVDREVFQHVDLENREQFDAARMLSEHVLNFLQRWYHEMYLPEHVAAFADLYLTRKLGELKIYDTIPLILVAKHPIIIYIDDVEQNSTQMYNDIRARGLIWLASETLDCNIIEARHLTMKPYGGLQVTSIRVDTRREGRLESTLQQVGHLITAGANYLSISEKCQQCPFRRRCML